MPFLFRKKCVGYEHGVGTTVRDELGTIGSCWLSLPMERGVPFVKGMLANKMVLVSLGGLDSSIEVTNG